MFDSAERHSHQVSSRVLGGTVLVLDRIQRTLDGCFNWVGRELRANRYRLDPSYRGSPDLYTFGPMTMTPDRARIIEAAVLRAKERSTHS